MLLFTQIYTKFFRFYYISEFLKSSLLPAVYQDAAQQDLCPMGANHTDHLLKSMCLHKGK